MAEECGKWLHVSSANAEWSLFMFMLMISWPRRLVRIGAHDDDGWYWWRGVDGFDWSQIIRDVRVRPGLW